MTLVLVRSAESLPRSDEWLSPGERERVAGFRFAKRRGDYLLGRWAAKHAVARALGRDDSLRALSAIEVRSDDDGAPEAWCGGARAELSLSLSHRADVAMCAAGDAGCRVGCDLERAEPRSDAFIEAYLAPRERVWLEGLEDPRRSLAATLLWSAKESALKALRTGLDIDTRQVVVSGIEWLERGGRGEPPSVWQPLVVSCPRAPEPMPGWWCARGGWLMTSVVQFDLAAPRWVQ